MIYSNFTGRVAKKAKVIDGVNGQFLSMDLAVNDYSRVQPLVRRLQVPNMLIFEFEIFKLSNKELSIFCLL